MKTYYLAGMLLLTTACATSPLGHRQLKFLPEDDLQRMGGTAYQKIRGETPAVQDPGVVGYVQCVARAITSQVDPRTNWEVTVFQDDSANAFALPGGKIGVNSGLLQVAQNQDQLASVLGHEVAHVVAEHQNARISASYAAEATQSLLAALATSGENSGQILGLLGVGVQYGVLMPYGRTQESEADLLGQRYMADAGFDPRASVSLWQNMARTQGSGPPAFLSTHPSHGSRIERLTEQMPEAMQRYEKAGAAGRRPQCG